MTFNLKKIVKDKMCIGCGLCAENISEMKISNDGNFIPINPIEDNISSHCPGIQVKNFIGNSTDSLWGSILDIRRVSSIDKSTNFKSSSGGGITELINYLLKSNTVDRVMCVVPDENDPYINSVLLVKNIKDLDQIKGSRYSPSTPLIKIRESIKDKFKYAVVGRPCDISALRSLLNSNDKLNKKFILLISFFCGGTPSIFGSMSLHEKSEQKSNLKFIRYRGNGWPGKTSLFYDKKQINFDYDYSWGSILGKHLTRRCKICSDSIGHNADMVFADAWNIEDKKPSFKESIGKSLLIIRTKKGKKIFERAKKNFILENRYQVKNLKIVQKHHMIRIKTGQSRRLALNFAGLETTKFINFKSFQSFESFSFKSILILIKSFIGSFLRVIRGKL